MEDTRKYIESLFSQNNINLTSKKSDLFNRFILDEINVNAVRVINDNQKMIVDKWALKNRIDDIILQFVSLPNGMVGKSYRAEFDIIKLGWEDIVYFEIRNLEGTGLEYDAVTRFITGMPKSSGDLKIKLFFRIKSEEDTSILNEKTISVIFNPDPKSLWQNIESDPTDLYWKEDTIALATDFVDKKMVISSKRGRSHANKGACREDHIAFKNFSNTGWSVLAVSDGAGSALASRKGSQIACESVISYFEDLFTEDYLRDFDQILLEYHNEKASETSDKINQFVYENLSKASLSVHNELVEFALSTGCSLHDFHATLIFTVVKKYDFGYAILTFGVGDCPIGLLNKEMTAVQLMNWLDVGEFGGGTRFITMAEIFQNEQFSTRFGFKLVEDFSYLMLMTDGIYDPKFVVEANLEKLESWVEFLEDLQGKNEEGVKIEFNRENFEIDTQLSQWMDFWISGNHDDRTLAIIY